MNWHAIGEVVGYVASGASIISLGITIPTYFAASGTKKALEAQNDVREFKQNINSQIDELESIYKTIKVDGILSQSLLETITDTLQTITIHYESVVKSFKKSINTLQKDVNESSERIKEQPEYNRSNIQKHLHAVIEHLKKARDRT